MRIPSADEAMQRWWAQRMRASATPSTVRALMDMNSLVDVRDALPAVRVPTLVLHRRGRRALQPRGGQVHRRPGAGCSVRAARGRGPLRLRRPGPDPRRGRAVRRRGAGAGGTGTGPGGAGVGDRSGRQGGRRRPRARRGPGAQGRGRVIRSCSSTDRRGRSARPSTHRRADAGVGVAVAEVERDAEVVLAYGVTVAVNIADAVPLGEVWLSEHGRRAARRVEHRGRAGRHSRLGRKRRARAPGPPPGLTAADAETGRPRRGTGRSAGGAVSAQELATSTITAVPLVTTSKTAERLRDCSTRAASCSASASPSTWNDDADVVVAVAHLGVDAEDAAQVDVALDGRRHALQVDAAGRRDVGDPAHQAGTQRVEQQLGRGRGVVLPDEHHGVVGGDRGRLLVLVLLAGPVEAGDGAAAVRPADPLVRRAELELGQRRLVPHDADGGEERLDIDAVAGLCRGLRWWSWWWFLSMGTALTG